jgi:hypothetical protein
MSMIAPGDATRRTANPLFPRSMTLPPVFAAICPADPDHIPGHDQVDVRRRVARQQIAHVPPTR